MIRGPCNIALNCHNLKNGEKKYFPESRFHKQNIYGFRNPSSLPWANKYGSCYKNSTNSLVVSGVIWIQSSNSR